MLANRDVMDFRKLQHFPHHSLLSMRTDFFELLIASRSKLGVSLNRVPATWSTFPCSELTKVNFFIHRGEHTKVSWTLHWALHPLL